MNLSDNEIKSIITQNFEGIKKNDIHIIMAGGSENNVDVLAKTDTCFFVLLVVDGKLEKYQKYDLVDEKI